MPSAPKVKRWPDPARPAKPLPPKLCEPCASGTRHGECDRVRRQGDCDRVARIGSCQCWQCNGKAMNLAIQQALKDYGSGAASVLRAALLDSEALRYAMYRRRAWEQAKEPVKMMCHGWTAAGNKCTRTKWWTPGVGRPPRWCSMTCKKRAARWLKRSHPATRLPGIPPHGRWESREEFDAWWLAQQLAEGAARGQDPAETARELGLTPSPRPGAARDAEPGLARPVVASTNMNDRSFIRASGPGDPPVPARDDPGYETVVPVSAAQPRPNPSRPWVVDYVEGRGWPPSPWLTWKEHDAAAGIT